MTDRPTSPADLEDRPYVRTRRMRELRWLLDATIRQIGVDWDQGRTRYTIYPAGLDAEPDFARVHERVRKIDDIHREFAASGRRREALGEAAEADGRLPARWVYGEAPRPLTRCRRGRRDRPIGYITTHLVFVGVHPSERPDRAAAHRE